MGEARSDVPAAAVRVAGLLLKVLGALAFVAAAYVIVAKGISAPLAPRSALAAGVLAAGAVALIAALGLRPAARVNFVLGLAVLGVGLLAVESYLTWPRLAPIEERKRAAADAAGRHFDGRTPSEVVLALRSQGKDAVPALFPAKMLRPSGEATKGPGTLRSLLELDGAEVVPLGGIANAITVHCNESGRYAIYASDERGLRNPRGLWGGGGIRLALVGDSFLHGDCVGEGEDVASRLRRRVAGTVTVGLRNHGPLLELASLRELLADARPPTVVWGFYEGNDLDDLERERRSPLLIGYLEDPGFRQPALRRSEEIDRFLRRFVEERISRDRGEIRDRVGSSGALGGKLVDILLLRSLRALLGLSAGDQGLSGWAMVQSRFPGFAGAGTESTATAPPEPDFALFARILRAARDTVSGWGGELVFLYLADPVRYCAAGRRWSADCPAPLDTARLDLVRRQVLATAADLGLRIIDLHARFTALDDPQGLYLYYGSHPNAAGHDAIAGSIVEALAAARR